MLQPGGVLLCLLGGGGVSVCVCVCVPCRWKSGHDVHVPAIPCRVLPSENKRLVVQRCCFVSLVFRDLVTGTALYEMAEKTLPLENQKPDLKLMTTYMKGTLL